MGNHPELVHGYWREQGIKAWIEACQSHQLLFSFRLRSVSRWPFSPQCPLCLCSFLSPLFDPDHLHASFCRGAVGWFPTEQFVWLWLSIRMTTRMIYANERLWSWNAIICTFSCIFMWKAVPIPIQESNTQSLPPNSTNWLHWIFISSVA